MSKSLKINIPDHIGDITLEQYQKYIKLGKREDLGEYELFKRKISLFCDIPYNKLDMVNVDDFYELNNYIDKALGTENKFTSRFKIKNVEFGFIPNFDNITAKEYVDISLYPHNEVETLHKLIAILFRPIINTDPFGNYSIESYQGTDSYAEVMKHTPLSVVDGAMVFFYNLAKELQKSIQKYTLLELVKVEQR